MTDKFNHVIQGLEQFTKDLEAGNLDDYRQYQFVREGDKLIRIGPKGERVEVTWPLKYQAPASGPLLP